MYKIVLFPFLAVFLTGAFFVASAQADTDALTASPQTAAIQPSDALNSSATAPLNKELAIKQAQFIKSARKWMHSANSFLLPSKRKPRIEKMTDGTYKAIYHTRREYHPDELSPATGNLFEVSKEKHGFSGIFRFVEVVYESYGSSPDLCMKGEFQPKVRRPNAQIFSFTNGIWR